MKYVRTSILTRMLFQILLHSTVSLSTAFINTGAELAAGELAGHLSQLYSYPNIYECPFGEQDALPKAIRGTYITC